VCLLYCYFTLHRNLVLKAVCSSKMYHCKEFEVQVSLPFKKCAQLSCWVYFLFYFFFTQFPYLSFDFCTGVSNRLYLSILAFSSTLLQSHPFLSTPLLTWSVHHMCGLPPGSYSIHQNSNNVSGTLCSPILLACAKHLSLLVSI
jgi:hypothetical protein